MRFSRRSFLCLCALSAISVSAPSCHAQNAALPVTDATANALMNKVDIGVGLEGLADWSRAKMFNSDELTRKPI